MIIFHDFVFALDAKDNGCRRILTFNLVKLNMNFLPLFLVASALRDFRVGIGLKYICTHTAAQPISFAVHASVIVGLHKASFLKHILFNLVQNICMFTFTYTADG